MKKIFLKNQLSLLVIVLSISLFVSGIVFVAYSYAGSISAPGGTPSAQSYTLSDIYHRLVSGTEATAGNHSLSPTTTPQSSFHSLSDVYNAISFPMPRILVTHNITGCYNSGPGTLSNNTAVQWLDMTSVKLIFSDETTSVTIDGVQLEEVPAEYVLEGVSQDVSVNVFQHSFCPE